MNALTPWLKDKKHVIWDWNGTLLSDLDHAVETVNVLLRENGLPEVSQDDYKKTFGFPVINYYKRLGFNTEPASFSQLCDRFNQLFYSGLHKCELWTGARELLTEIKSSGKTQSVLSASEHPMLLQTLKQYDIHHLFDHVFGIFDKTAASKLDRGRELIATAQMPKKDTVLIGDTDHDLEVGTALGIDVILVEHGHQCPIKLKSVHHQVVKVF